MKRPPEAVIILGLVVLAGLVLGGLLSLLGFSEAVFGLLEELGKAWRGER